MILTAKEFLNSNSLKGHVVMDSVDEGDIERDMIEFARLHVKNFEKLLEESNINARQYLELHVK